MTLQGTRVWMVLAIGLMQVAMASAQETPEMTLPGLDGTIPPGLIETVPAGLPEVVPLDLDGEVEVPAEEPDQRQPAIESIQPPGPDPNTGRGYPHDAMIGSTYGARPNTTRITVHADLLLWSRCSPSDQPLVYTPGDQVMLGGSDLGFSMHAGVRTGFTLHDCAGADLQFLYSTITMGADETVRWRELEYRPPGATIVGDAFSADYETTYDSLEMNVGKLYWRRMEFFGGVRWVKLDDELSIDSSPFAEGSVIDRFETQNRLLGLQVGGSTLLWAQGGPLEVDLNLKTGLYFNNIDLHAERLIPSGIAGRASAESDKPAFIGELGVVGRYRLRNWLTFRLGYEMVWIEGVTMATDSVAMSVLSTGDAKITATDSFLMHGLTLGLEGTF